MFHQEKSGNTAQECNIEFEYVAKREVVRLCNVRANRNCTVEGEETCSTVYETGDDGKFLSELHFENYKSNLPCDCEVRALCRCKEMPVIQVNTVVDKKRIMVKNDGHRRRRGARGC
jgi:hypothetical protein